MNWRFEKWPDIQTVLNEVANNNSLHVNSASAISDACSIAEICGFSFYDSLSIAAERLPRLLSEDYRIAK